MFLCMCVCVCVCARARARALGHFVGGLLQITDYNARNEQHRHSPSARIPVLKMFFLGIRFKTHRPPR